LASLQESAMRERRGSSGFTLIELLVVVAVIATLSTIAFPSYQQARRKAIETQVVGDLNAMAKTQQLFWLSPVPVRPSSMSVPQKRYARIHELNSFARNAFGRTVSRYYIEKSAGVRFQMVPLWPSTRSLENGRFTIEARGTGSYNFIFSVDESGKVVKLR
jgi:prepilin-type N-terminal cleavage/methylation domain-containing protein